eukprot:7070332-Prymnesium_polylepis.1
MGFVFLSGITIPLDIAYSNIIGDAAETTLEVLEWIYICVFTPDLVLSFFLTYMDDNGAECNELRQTATQYLKTWFMVDFVAIFPFDQVNKNSSALSLLKVRPAPHDK